MVIDYSDFERFDAETPYATVLQRQRELHAGIAEGVRANTVLWGEHHSVYTLGRKTHSAHYPAELPYPVCSIERGGSITYHGPGQWVVYPLGKLPPRGLLAFVRGLEQALLEGLTTLGYPLGVREGFSGLWVLPAVAKALGYQRPVKVGFIGLAFRQGVTLHGVSINITRESLVGFKIAGLLPCGLADIEVACLAELHEQLALRHPAPTVESIGSQLIQAVY
jgi:lipoyl(octanoyl) transferase